MIPGTPVTIGGKKYLMPPLNINSMKLHKPTLVRLMKGAVSGDIDPVTAVESDLEELTGVIHSALKRNYPELTIEDLGEHIDLANIQELVQTAIKTSGFVDRLEGAAAGEA